MFRALLFVLALTAAPAQAAVLTEANAGEFSGSFAAPTDFTGFETVVADASAAVDNDYFVFNSLLPGTTALRFALANFGAGANVRIRLSSTPFTLPEWDWQISPLTAPQELYANSFAPSDVFDYEVPLGFNGPIYGLVSFYSASVGTSLSVSQIGTAAVVPLPGSALLLITGLFGLGLTRRLSPPRV